MCVCVCVCGCVCGLVAASYDFGTWNNLPRIDHKLENVTGNLQLEAGGCGLRI